MKSNIHHIVEQVTQALGPIFHANPDYEDIRVAMAMVMARVIQATPHQGLEIQVRDATFNDIHYTLNQLLELEAAGKAKLDAGIAKFADFAGPINGHAAGEPPTVDFHYRDAEGNLTPHGVESLAEAVIKLHTPDEEVVFAEVPEEEAEGETFRESIAQVERDLEARAEEETRPDQDDFNPDGPPRSYTQG